MSSGLLMALAQLRLNDYMSLVILMAVSYDFCLTFPKEVTYIWRRPWTRVSTLFLLIRYVGYLSAFTFALNGSNIMNIISAWARADILMVLRVYAMYSRSKTILGILLVMYIAEITTIFVGSGAYSMPKYAAVSTVQLLDATVCSVTFSTQTWNIVPTIFQFILGTVLCGLVVARFAKDSLQTYRATQNWSLNRYMNLLTRDGLLYFLVTFMNSLLNMLGILGIIPQGWVSLVLIPVADVPLYTLAPRFVLNVRELYVLDVQGRLNCDLDSGFGLSSGAVHRREVPTSIGTIAFARGDGIEELGDGEELYTI